MADPRSLAEAAPAPRLEAFQARTASIGVIGLGYVGLPLARALCAAGFPVLGFDIDPVKIESLNAGRSYLKQTPDHAIQAMRAQGFAATADIARVAELDALLIAVPTPLTRHREPDLRFVERTVEAVAPHLKPGALLVLESTTYPGTTTGVVRPILQRHGRVIDTDVYLAYSPEREDPGNAQYDAARIPKVVGADSTAALALAAALYASFVPQVVPVSSSATAEAVKLTENIFRAVNIAMVNELKLIYTRMGIDVFEVIDAAATKPFGFMPFYPGPGLGGHCIPIDPFYLTWKAREYGLHTRFIELAGEINSAMPDYVLARLCAALDRQQQRGLYGTRVLVLGVAYKKNVDDMRESPALVLIERLIARGAEVHYHDPHVAVIPPTRQHAPLAGMASVALSAEEIAAAHAVLLVTDHDAVDYALLRTAALVVDTRDALRRHGIDGVNVIAA